MHHSTWAVAILAALPAISAVPTDLTTKTMDRDTFYSLTLPEYTPDGDKLVDLRFSFLNKRGDCGTVPGLANGECVNYYSAGGCHGDDHIKGYKPTCGGNCYVDEFSSVRASGDGTYSTNCDLFSDTWCGNKVASVGGKTGGGQCATARGWSMKCYYRC